MAINALCGSSASITVGTFAYSAHSFTLELTAQEVDIRGFGSGDYGDWLACALNGRLSAQMYEVPTCGVGDTVAFVLTLPYASPGSTITMSGSAVVTEKGLNVDAKGVVENTLGMRVTGDISVA